MKNHETTLKNHGNQPKTKLFSRPDQPVFCIVDTGPCFLAHRSKTLVQTFKSFESCFVCHTHNLLQKATKNWDQGCRKFMSCYFLAHRSKTFVHTLKKSLKGVLPVKSDDDYMSQAILSRHLSHLRAVLLHVILFLFSPLKIICPDFEKVIESCFACQDHNLPTTITCHRRLVPLMVERQKKPSLIQRHFSGIGFIMNGSLECRATGKTIFTTTITLAIIQPSHQYFCEPQPWKEGK